MSRNFELLQRLGTTFSGYDADHAAAATTSVSPAPVAQPAFGLAGDDAPIRSLLQSLFLTNPKGPRVVLFSPAEAQDGENAIVAKAAELLARSVEGRVCIVNLRESSGAGVELMDVLDGDGLREALFQPFALDHYLVPLAERNLFLLRRGNAQSSSVTRDRWMQRFVELRSRFDYVLIDAPAIAQSAESVLAAQLSDGVVMIVEANTTRREQVASVCERLQSSKIKVLGAVLNNRTFPIPQGIYSRL